MIDAEYHSGLASRLESAIKLGRALSLEDQCGALAASNAIARGILTEDFARLDFLDRECKAGRVVLKINGVQRGKGLTARLAIDDAMIDKGDKSK